MIHELKTWRDAFKVIKRGDKKHDIRKNDRPFAVGDMLYLREWDNAITQDYTGESVHVLVTYISEGGTWGLPRDMCVMSIQVIDTP